MEPDRLFHNALSAEAGYPCRLTPEQRAWYHLTSRTLADRADCNAGIKMAFVTRAARLSFSYQVVSRCREQNAVDVFENGAQTATVALETAQPGGTFSHIRETGGQALIELVLPNTCGLRILDADFGAWQPAPRPARKLLLLGDSIAQGIASYGPACSLGFQLSRAWNAETVNQSVGSSRVWPVTLARLPYRPERILAAVGVNDIPNLREDEFTLRAGQYFDKLRSLYPDARITAVTPVWNTRMRREEYAAAARAAARMIAAACERNHIETVGGDTLVPHADRFFTKDGLQPNDLGFVSYAQNLLQRIQW